MTTIIYLLLILCFIYALYKSIHESIVTKYNERTFKNRKYPYIGANGDRYSPVIVFTAPFTGVVIKKKESLWTVGYTSDGWEEKEFSIVGNRSEALAKLEELKSMQT